MPNYCESTKVLKVVVNLSNKMMKKFNNEYYGMSMRIVLLQCLIKMIVNRNVYHMKYKETLKNLKI